MKAAKQRTAAGIQLSRQAFKRANLGHSFAEHDFIRQKDKRDLFVETPAIVAASDSSKCFFVGRRGTGKTAITYYLSDRYPKNSLLLLPKLLSAGDPFITSEWSVEAHQKPFATLVSAFIRAILDEVACEWRRQGLFTFRSSDGELVRERGYIEKMAFDVRLVNLVEEGFRSLRESPTKDWLAFRNRPKAIAAEMAEEYDEDKRMRFFVLIDRLDDVGRIR